jgi:hypothetical protein
MHYDYCIQNYLVTDNYILYVSWRLVWKVVDQSKFHCTGLYVQVQMVVKSVV